MKLNYIGTKFLNFIQDDRNGFPLPIVALSDWLGED